MKRISSVDEYKHNPPSLIFPIEIGCDVTGRIVLCSSIGSNSLNKCEKWLVKMAFVFKRKRG